MTIASGWRVGWEVRIGGDDLNGGAFNRSRAGAGTDYTLQNAAQQAYTDLAVDAAVNTRVSSATRNFVAADVGNHIQIQASAGWTAGFYEIVSITGTAANLDRSPAAVSVTGGVGRLGGALASYTKAAANQGVMNTVWIKDDGTPFTTTTGITATNANGNVDFPNGNWFMFRGYGSIRGDGGRPTLKVGANNISLISRGDGTYGTLYNLILDGNGANFTTNTRALEIGNNQNVGFHNCIIQNFTTNAMISNAAGLVYDFCKFYNCRTSASSFFGGNGASANYCLFDTIVHTSTGGGANGIFTNVASLRNCIFTNVSFANPTNGNAGIITLNAQYYATVEIVNNTFVGATKATCPPAINSYDSFQEAGSRAVIRNNLVMHTQGGIWVGGAGYTGIGFVIQNNRAYDIATPGFVYDQSPGVTNLVNNTDNVVLSSNPLINETTDPEPVVGGALVGVAAIPSFFPSGITVVGDIGAVKGRSAATSSLGMEGWV